MRLPADLEGLDGLVLPGGESTTMSLLMERMGLTGPVREALERGMPALGTCAGMILMAREITDGVTGQEGFGLLDIAVRRNGYGRQVESFEAALEIEGLDGGPFPGVFIRAPLVLDPGRTQVLARHDGHAVAVRQGNLMALCFHPELSSDLRLHREFIRIAEGSR